MWHTFVVTESLKNSTIYQLNRVLVLIGLPDKVSAKKNPLFNQVKTEIDNYLKKLTVDGESWATIKAKMESIGNILNSGKFSNHEFLLMQRRLKNAIVKIFKEAIQNTLEGIDITLATNWADVQERITANISLLQIDPTMLLEPFNLQTFVEDRTMDNIEDRKAEIREGMEKMLEKERAATCLSVDPKVCYQTLCPGDDGSCPSREFDGTTYYFDNVESIYSVVVPYPAAAGYGITTVCLDIREVVTEIKKGYSTLQLGKTKFPHIDPLCFFAAEVVPILIEKELKCLKTQTINGEKEERKSFIEQNRGVEYLALFELAIRAVLSLSDGIDTVVRNMDKEWQAIYMETWDYRQAKMRTDVTESYLIDRTYRHYLENNPFNVQEREKLMTDEEIIIEDAMLTIRASEHDLTKMELITLLDRKINFAKSSITMNCFEKIIKNMGNDRAVLFFRYCSSSDESLFAVVARAMFGGSCLRVAFASLGDHLSYCRKIYDLPAFNLNRISNELTKYLDSNSQILNIATIVEFANINNIMLI